MLRFLLSQKRAQRNVQANHRQWQVTLQNRVGSLGVLVDVGFSNVSNVTFNRQCTTHERNVADQVSNFRILFQGSGQVGHWASRNDDQILAILVGCFDVEVDTGFSFNGTLRGWQLNIADPVVTVNVFRNLHNFKAVGRAGVWQTFVDRHIGLAEQFQKLQTVFSTNVQQVVTV